MTNRQFRLALFGAVLFLALLLSGSSLPAQSQGKSLLVDKLESITTNGAYKYTQTETISSTDSIRGGRVQGSVEVVDGKEGKALHLSGPSRIEYPTSGNVDLSGGEVSFRVAMNFDPAENSERTQNALRNQIFLTFTGPGPSKVMIYSTLTYLNLAVFNDQGNLAYVDNTPAAWKANEWHDVRVAWGSTIELWIDGKKKFSAPWNGLFGPIPVRPADSLIVIGSTAGGIENEFSVDDLVIKAPDEKRISTRPRISLPLLSEEPTVDGKLTEPFWQKAAMVSGFVGLENNELVESQPVVYAAYTEKGLHFGLEANLGKGRSPQAMLTERDASIYSEDALEVFLRPADAGTAYYQLITSAIGTRLDAQVSAGAEGNGTPSVNLSFNPEWSVKTASRPGGWTAEMFVPFGSLKGAKRPQPGEVWTGNFCLDSAGGSGNAATWSFVAGNFQQPVYFGELLFTGSGRTLRQESFGGFAQGEPRVTQALVGDIQPVVTVKAEIFNSAGSRIYQLETPLRDFKTAEIKPGSLPSGSYTYTLSATEPDGRLLFYQSFGFKTSKALSLSAENYPYAGHLQVRADVRGMKAAAAKIVCSILSQESKTVGKLELTGFSGGVGAGRFETEGLVPGQYEVKAEAVSADGRVLESAGQTLKLFPKPAWWKNDLGTDHTVPPPFQTVRAAGDRLSVWGRDYVFGDAIFPQQIVNQEKALFSRSPVFSLKMDGQDINLSSIKKTNASTHPDIITLAGEQAFGNASLGCKSTLEFDGCLRFDLAISPKKPVKLENLTLTIPIKSEVAKFLLSSNGISCNITPADKGFSSGFMPYVWLGNDYMGLAFFAESDEYWMPAEKKAIEVVPGREETVLKINFIAQPYTLDKPATFTFGLMASPVKPIPENDPFRYTHQGPPREVNFPEFLVYSMPKDTSPDEGTLEFWCKRSGTKCGRSTQVFHLTGGKKKIDCLLQTPDQPDTLVLISGDQRLLTSKVNINAESFSHMAFVWDKNSLSVYSDGKLAGKVEENPFKDALDGDTVRMRLGCDDDAHSFTGLVVDEVRISKIARYSENFSPPQGPFAADKVAVLLDHMDRKFKPDGQNAETEAGGVPSLGCAFVPGKFGNGLMLEVAPPKPGLQVLKDTEVKVVTDWVYQDQNKYGWPPVFFEETLPGVKSRNSQLQAINIQSIPYMVYPALGAPSPLAEQFGKEWCIQPICTAPSTPPQGHYWINACVKAKGLQDYYVASTQWLMDELGYNGDYTDGLAHVYPCQNRDHGCGYVSKDGSLHPTRPIFAVRECMKRIYKVVKSRQPDGLVVNHVSFNLILPTLSLSDILYTGEHEDYKNLLNARMRFTGRPWGIYVALLGSSEHVYSSLHTMAGLLVGSSIWNMDFDGRNDMSRKYDNIRRAHEGFPIKTAKWVPYFEAEGDYYEVSEPQVKASIYYHQGKDIFLVVGNFADHPVQPSLKLNMARFGLDGKAIRATNALTQEDVRVSGDGILTPSVKEESFVLVKVSAE